MNDDRLETHGWSGMLWKMLFFTLVAGYCLYYAPFGVNETDGGFLTGLGWQVLSGKVLYQDIVYVRPPMPVWLRALELQLLPDHLAILGERWIFYVKIGLYSYLGAAVLTKGENRWPLAVFGFVVSAHCYPPMAWHTVDGILFGVLAAFFATRGTTAGWGLAGISLCCALLCKQSFYPLLPLFGLYLCLENETRFGKTIWFGGAIALCTGLFVNYLHQNNLLSNYLQMTAGAAAGGQAIQHGLLDYFRITPELALPSILLLAPVAWWFWKGKGPRIAFAAWSMWLFALMASYAAITWLRQDHTVPFAQSRALFWVALLVFGIPFIAHRSSLLVHRSPLLLLGISWCASISWGYNLPILFAVPLVWAVMELTRNLAEASQAIKFSTLYRLGMLIALLLAFRAGYEFVYRDGRRSEMHEPMGAIFLQLSGIYSDRETAALYRDLKALSERYGPNFKTLPAFPQANFLAHSPPPLPLDWVVNRETNGDNSLVINNLRQKSPILFIQKSFREKIDSDPELEITRRLLKSGTIVEETPHFWVVGNYER